MLIPVLILLPVCMAPFVFCLRSSGPRLRWGTFLGVVLAEDAMDLSDLDFWDAYEDEGE